MDNSIENIVAQLPLSVDLRDALLAQKDVIGEALKCCVAFERANWETVQLQGLDAVELQKAYFNSVIWSNDAMTLVANK